MLGPWPLCVGLAPCPCSTLTGRGPGQPVPLPGPRSAFFLPQGPCCRPASPMALRMWSKSRCGCVLGATPGVCSYYFPDGAAEAPIGREVSWGGTGSCQSPGASVPAPRPQGGASCPEFSESPAGSFWTRAGISPPRRGCPCPLSLLLSYPTDKYARSSQALQNRPALSISDYFLSVYTVYVLPV